MSGSRSTVDFKVDPFSCPIYYSINQSCGSEYQVNTTIPVFQFGALRLPGSILQAYNTSPDRSSHQLKPLLTFIHSPMIDSSVEVCISHEIVYLFANKQIFDSASPALEQGIWHMEMFNNCFLMFTPKVGKSLIYLFQIIQIVQNLNAE